MIHKLLKLFSNLKLRYVLWQNEREVGKEFSKALMPLPCNPTHYMYQDSVQHAYMEGLVKIKKKVNEKAEEQGYEKTLQSTEELVELAEHDDLQRKAVIDTLRSAYIFKNEKTKKEMIGDRIGHYYDLQKYNEERQLIKSIKKAKKEGNIDLISQLEKEWSQKYGRITKN